MKNEYAVETKNVTKYYEKTNHIFDNMSISFQTGKIIGLIGKNGSGKTTFIKLISGMTQQSEGDIYILGEKMTCENSVVLLRKYISVLGDEESQAKTLAGLKSAEGFIRSKLDFEFVMVTNQDGLGTSSFPEDTFWPVHNLVLKTLEGEGIILMIS